jgi:hypothetical protein
MNYRIDNLENLLSSLSLSPKPQYLIDEIEENISKIKVSGKTFDSIDDAYDYFIDNIHDLSVVKKFVNTGILKLDPITPLFHALMADKIDVGKYLIKSGADFDATIQLLKQYLDIDELKRIYKAVKST